MPTIKDELAEILKKSAKDLFGEDEASFDLAQSFETPKEEKFGDLSTNAALRLAKEKKKSPREVAENLSKTIQANLNASKIKTRIAKLSVEGPGFINFYYSSEEIASILLKINQEGQNFGKPKNLSIKNILLEFVSANPTGPLTVAHGRQAALGDSLAKILIFCGHKVRKEYYNNDEGVQINILGESIRSRYLTKIGIENTFPENGYKGDYIGTIAEEIKLKYGKKAEKEPISFFSRYGKDTIMEGIKKDLHDFGVEFDSYYSQEALMKSGKVEKTLETLRQKGFVYDKEGAVWFESTRLGDDKDRVLIKSDKSYTYLTPDIAYHADKFSRKFDYLINILGPDHHGYIPRIKASAEALGFSRDALNILIAQLVTLFEGEKTLRMSTRAGEFVTLREIIDEVGKDAGRFFFLMRKFDAHLDFDLGLAKSQTPENPVFYIQYAHARIESIKKNAKEKGVETDWKKAECLSKLTALEEIALMRLLSQFGEAVFGAGVTLEPYRLVPYLKDLAAAFHRFYTEHYVINDDLELSRARLMLVDSTQNVLRQGLCLLGVSAPLKM